MRIVNKNRENKKQMDVSICFLTLQLAGVLFSRTAYFGEKLNDLDQGTNGDKH